MEKSLNWKIYRHTSPSGKVYIGITSREVNTRWQYGNGYRHCTVFLNAIKRYGWKNIKHEVLFKNLSEEKAKKLEIDFIRHYKNLGISYNITDGGDGHLGVSWTPSEETRLLWSKQRKGKIITEEQKSKISKSLKGKVFSREVILKANNRKKELSSKATLQISLDGVIIKEYPSLREAAKSINVAPSDIYRCCIGKRKTRCGYIWKYKDEYLKSR